MRIMDFSRQLKVSGMSEAAQLSLHAAKVLVFGAGGLATTAVPYLAAAGVGKITIVDGDKIALSNLHRQILFEYQQIGEYKTDCMARFCTNRGAGEYVSVHRYLEGDELLAAVRAHHLILDCSDNRELAYQLNDAALIAAKPVIFANATAMSGQLFTLQPDNDLPCWRCVWSESMPPGGNCETQGVIGPVPAIVGAWQALEAIKLITHFSPALKGQLLQYDFAAMRQILLRVPRQTSCNHNPTALSAIRTFSGQWSEAKAQGWQIIDIREAAESAAKPLLAADCCVPMPMLLAQPNDYIDKENTVLLVCARGTRAKHAAKCLAERGYHQLIAFNKAW